MSRMPALLLLVILILSACAVQVPAQVEDSPQQQAVVTVFKPPTWGCCGEWTEYMEENGYSVESEPVANLAEVKFEHQIPSELQSCHTAIVDGYIIEGHVPVEDVERLLAERPDVAGLAVPGMPVGSPGMEVDGYADQPFDVIAFDHKGNMEVFSSHAD